MKKVLTLLFVALVGVFALTGCVGNDNTANDKNAGDTKTVITTTVFEKGVN